MADQRTITVGIGTYTCGCRYFQKGAKHDVFMPCDVHGRDVGPIIADLRRVMVRACDDSDRLEGETGWSQEMADEMKAQREDTREVIERAIATLRRLA